MAEFGTSKRPSAEYIMHNTVAAMDYVEADWNAGASRWDKLLENAGAFKDNVYPEGMEVLDYIAKHAGAEEAQAAIKLVNDITLSANVIDDMGLDNFITVLDMNVRPSLRRLNEILEAIPA